MYTVKIAWQRIDAEGTETDQTTFFILADQVRVHGPVTESGMTEWQDVDFYECRIAEELENGETKLRDGRLIAARLKDVDTWYTASRAWLLGPDGRTIERIAP